jgi:predicted Rossmann-fold nucleotide-binding protein
MPGGLGTADELFEALVLIQTKKILNFPVVIMGKTYWAPLITQLQEMMAAKMIGAADLDLMLITDDVREALAHIERHAIDGFGLTRRRIRSSRLLGEPRDDLVSAR